MTAGAAAIVGAAYAGGCGAMALRHLLVQSAGTDKNSALYGLAKTLPKNSKVLTRRLASLDEFERKALIVELPAFQVDGWLQAQGAKKDETGQYLLEGYDVSTEQTAKPKWSHVDWVRVAVMAPNPFARGSAR